MRCSSSALAFVKRCESPHRLQVPYPKRAFPTDPRCLKFWDVKHNFTPTRPAPADVGVREGMPYAGAQEGRSIGDAWGSPSGCIVHNTTHAELSEWCRRGKAHPWAACIKVTCLKKEKKKKKEPPDSGRGSAFRESGISMVSASDARQGTSYGSVERKGRSRPCPSPCSRPRPSEARFAGGCTVEEFGITNPTRCVAKSNDDLRVVWSLNSFWAAFVRSERTTASSWISTPVLTGESCNAK